MNTLRARRADGTTGTDGAICAYEAAFALDSSHTGWPGWALLTG